MVTDREALRLVMQRIRDTVPDVASAIEARFDQGKLVPFGSLPEDERRSKSDAVADALGDAEDTKVRGPSKTDMIHVDLSTSERLEIAYEYVLSLAHSMVASREVLRELGDHAEQLTITFVDPQAADEQTQTGEREPTGQRYALGTPSPNERRLREILREHGPELEAGAR